MNGQGKHVLIDALKAQHAHLVSDITRLHELASMEPGDAAAFRSELRKFQADIEAHWQLEDHTFYSEYLKLQREKNESTERILTYIKEMQVIEKVVRMSLDRFLSSDTDGSGTVEAFMPQFKQIAEILTVRIETEEEGPYEKFLAKE